ncbi:MAG: methyltransferase regulatory domain-containing protein [Hoeflea sp.]|nr:methyltransferase regulatory domain-containing protein [Hoeflea sp.]
MWHAGYITEIEYSHGYFHELSPLRLKLAMEIAGQRASLPASPCYLELGFGQGESLNINAATNPGSFWGTDFNPAHAATTRDIAAKSGADLIALEASFEELAARDDLPEFDIIALHGIWTWISDRNRAIIVDIARRKLKPGGLFYISYNVTPGWSPSIPLRHIMKEHSKRASVGPIPHRMNEAKKFVQSLFDAGSTYFKANPGVVDRFNKLKDQNPNYVAHEYLNENWDVMPFSQVADQLSDAKLNFAASAHLLDAIDEINLSADAQKLLSQIEDIVLRETTRDYFVNQNFRRDIFVKGQRPLESFEKNRLLMNQPFMIMMRPEDQPRKVTGSLGEGDLNASVYEPIFAALASEDYRPKTISEIIGMPGCEALSIAQIYQCIVILCGSFRVAPAHDEDVFKAVKPTSKALNDEITRRAVYSDSINFLAAPLIGAGVPTNRFEQLFVRAIDLDQEDVALWVWTLIRDQGQKLVKDGKPIEADEDNLNELREKYGEFETKRLPIFKRLGII